MREVTVNFIGAGSLGKTIAKLIAVKKIGRIIGVCNSTFESGKNAADFIGQGMAYSFIHNLPPSDVTFITVSDDKIKDICEALSKSENFNTNSTIIHCSGLLTSDILFAAMNKGANIASAHPIRSFADPEISVREFTGTWCAIEGDNNGEEVARNIFSAIGAKVIKIEKHKKAIYHASAVIASNYLVTLANTAIKCLVSADIDQEDSMDIILNMMQGTLKNLNSIRSPEKSLTGPIKRGDIQTIKSHMASFENKLIKDLYAILGESTLELTCHNEEKIKLLKDALTEKTLGNSYSNLKAKL